MVVERFSSLRGDGSELVLREWIVDGIELNVNDNVGDSPLALRRVGVGRSTAPTLEQLAIEGGCGGGFVVHGDGCNFGLESTFAF